MAEPREIISFRLIPNRVKRGGEVVETRPALVAEAADGEELIAFLTPESGVKLAVQLAKAFGVRLSRVAGERILIRDAQGRPTSAIDLV